MNDTREEMAGHAPAIFRSEGPSRLFRVFSSEVVTGSRQENAIHQIVRAHSANRNSLNALWLPDRISGRPAINLNRMSTLPADIQKAVTMHMETTRIFGHLPHSHQHEYLKGIARAKASVPREKRIENMQTHRAEKWSRFFAGAPFENTGIGGMQKTEAAPGTDALRFKRLRGA